MRNRLTFNFNCAEISPHNYYSKMDDFILNGTSDYVYLLNPLPKYIDMALSRGKKVVVRYFDPFSQWFGDGQFDNKFHLTNSPESCLGFLRKHASAYRNKEVYFIVGYNEPVYHDMKNQMNWFIHFGELAVLDGFKVALGGWNTSKSIIVKSDGSCPDIDNGIWDGILKFANEHRDSVILDFHDYTLGISWAQQVEGFPQVLLDQSLLSKSRTPLVWDSINVNDQWHIGRHAPLLHRARSLDLKVRFGLGECILDRMDDVSSVMNQMSQSFGMSEFNKEMRGFPSLYEYYRYLLGSANYDAEKFSKLCYDNLKYIDEEYPSEFEYFAVFAYNGNAEWRKCDVSRPEMTHFVNLVKVHEKKEFGQDMFYNGEFRRGKITNLDAKYSRTIRKEPIITDNRDGTLIVGGVINGEISVESFLNGDYMWRAFKTDDNKVLYIAENHVLNSSLKYIGVDFDVVEAPDDGDIFDFYLDFYKYEILIPQTSLEHLRKISDYYKLSSQLPFAPEEAKNHFKKMSEIMDYHISLL